jgi:hypothetical protein
MTLGEVALSAIPGSGKPTDSSKLVDGWPSPTMTEKKKRRLGRG